MKVKIVSTHFADINYESDRWQEFSSNTVEVDNNLIQYLYLANYIEHKKETVPNTYYLYLGKRLFLLDIYVSVNFRLRYVVKRIHINPKGADALSHILISGYLD